MKENIYQLNVSMRLRYKFRRTQSEPCLKCMAKYGLRTKPRVSRYLLASLKTFGDRFMYC